MEVLRSPPPPHVWEAGAWKRDKLPTTQLVTKNKTVKCEPVIQSQIEPKQEPQAPMDYPCCSKTEAAPATPPRVKVEQARRRLKDLNVHLCCPLCSGYFIEPVTLNECGHAYCRVCILQYLPNHDRCPRCDAKIPGLDPDKRFKPDNVLQSLVFKLAPHVYREELLRRKSFFDDWQGTLDDPACKDVPNVRRKLFPAKFLEMGVGIFAPDDLISFVLECAEKRSCSADFSCGDEKPSDIQDTSVLSNRFFRCPGKVPVSTLQKLLLLKLGVASTPSANVQIFLRGEALDGDLKLLDVAYRSSWRRTEPVKLTFSVTGTELKKSEPEDVMPELTVETDQPVCREALDTCAPPLLFPETYDDPPTLADMLVPSPEPLQPLSPAIPIQSSGVDLNRRETSPPVLRPTSPSVTSGPTFLLSRPSFNCQTSIPQNFARNGVLGGAVGITIRDRQEHIAATPTVSHPSVIVTAPGTKPTVEVRPEIRKKVALVRPKEPVQHQPTDLSPKGPCLPPASSSASNSVFPLCVTAPTSQLFRPLVNPYSPLALALNSQAVLQQQALNPGYYYLVPNPGLLACRPSLTLPTAPPVLPAVQKRISPPQMHRLQKRPIAPAIESKPVGCPLPTTPAQPLKQDDDHESAAVFGSKRRKLLSPVRRPPQMVPDCSLAASQNELSNKGSQAFEERAAASHSGAFPYLLKLASSCTQK